MTFETLNLIKASQWLTALLYLGTGQTLGILGCPCRDRSGQGHIMNNRDYRNILFHLEIIPEEFKTDSTGFASDRAFPVPRPA